MICMLHKTVTRMHSSRMRTARSLSYGGLTATPPGQRARDYRQITGPKLRLRAVINLELFCEQILYWSGSKNWTWYQFKWRKKLLFFWLTGFWTHCWLFSFFFVKNLVKGKREILLTTAGKSHKRKDTTTELKLQFKVGTPFSVSFYVYVIKMQNIKSYC